ncbi:MAG TPA: hypothetical protein VHM25_17640, partial [Polyangiaceae bacterium]|nr:hypothetical protein [Polyangiaceae bacterium]
MTEAAPVRMQNPEAIKINKRTMLATSMALGGAALTGCAGVSAASPTHLPSNGTQTGFVRRDGMR